MAYSVEIAKKQWEPLNIKLQAKPLLFQSSRQHFYSRLFVGFIQGPTQNGTHWDSYFMKDQWWPPSLMGMVTGLLGSVPDRDSRLKRRQEIRVRISDIEISAAEIRPHLNQFFHRSQFTIHRFRMVLSPFSRNFDFWLVHTLVLFILEPGSCTRMYLCNVI